MPKPTVLKGEAVEKYAFEMFGGIVQQISASIATEPIVKEFTNNPDEWEVQSVSYTKTEDGINETATLYNDAKKSTVEISITNVDRLGE